MVAKIDSAVWKRALTPALAEGDPEVARLLLQIRLAPPDVDRVNVLSAGARAGTLSSAEEAELDAYLRIGHTIALLQSSARLALKAVKAKR